MLCCGRLFAQDDKRFVYIQNEKGQPFYVKINGQVLSSSEKGYIILPRLEAGTVPVTIGFARNEGPEQKFYLRISNSDQGFLLKKNTLYNLQSFREIKADNGDGTALAAAQEPEVPAANTEDTARKEMMGNLQKDLETTFAGNSAATVTGPAKAATPKNSNSFSSALDKVVVTGDDRDEPQPVAATEGKQLPAKKQRVEKAPLSEEEKALLNEVLAEESRTAASEAATEEVKESAREAKRQKKQKKREGSPDFIEFQDDSAHPANTSVPAPVPAAVTPAPVTDLPVAEAEEAPARSKKKKRKLFDDTEHPNNIITDSSGYGIAPAAEAAAPAGSKRKKKRNEAADEAATTAMPAATPAVEADAAVEKKRPDTRLINSDCGNIMDDATFRKVLRKFVAAKSEDGMIDVFRRQTRNYCLETSQIKTLVQLLTTDDNRYRLLDQAYSKTYDTEKYGSLESLLGDSYFKGRFKAMLHK
ncbi:DUF4476 domain-containing protein [Chitinophaga solisilvae]|uniref:DUF4476 domain-containing protein n=1 Tax=Chitinophaga solisilvae TaxID=1233460 RepID=UPI001371F6C2|nr:DUF4476 domain-containing protein [Chitinophaga solisilvae]